MNKNTYRLPCILLTLLLAAPASRLGAQQLNNDDKDQEAAFASELSGPAGDSVRNEDDPTRLMAPGKPPAMKPPTMPEGLSVPPMPRGLREKLARSKAASGSPISAGNEVAKSGSSGAKMQESSLKAADLVSASLKLDDKVGEITISDMPINDVLDMLQNLTGKAILRHSAIAGTFTFKSEGQMTRREAVDAISSLLMLNGVAIVPLGDNYLKAVPATAAANHSPELIDGSTLDYEPSQVVCSKLFHINFIPITDAVSALSSIQSSLVGTAITGFEKNSSVLATDSIANLQRMETLLSRIDNPSDKEKLFCIQLENVSASDAETRCQQFLSGAMATRFTGNTTIDSDERTNQLIIVTKPANEALIRQLVASLDTDVDPLTRTEMFSIRHADAEELSEVINEVISGQKEVRDDTSTSSSKSSAQNIKQKKNVQTTSATTSSGSSTAGSQFSNYISIVPDERTNTIVATGTPSDIRLLSEMIEKLDAVLPQVRIEVVIAEVTLTDTENSGLESFGLQYSSTAPDDALDASSTTGKKTYISGSGYQDTFSISPFSLDNFSMDAVFNVAKSNSNIKVVSAPTIVTTHNKEASIVIGSKEPVVSAYETNSDDDDDDLTSISYEDIAIELTVKPLIGSNGVIQMEIDQKVDEVSDRVTIAGYGDQPVIGNREATSYVSVANGKMIVLGGLQKESKTTVRNKLFILGDIPLLGNWLFSPKQDKTERTELIMFIRPVLLANPDEADIDARKMISENQSVEKINKLLKDGNFRTPEEDERDRRNEEEK